jgi:hypothetical protein
MEEVVDTLYKRYLSYVLNEMFDITTPKDETKTAIKRLIA